MFSTEYKRGDGHWEQWSHYFDKKATRVNLAMVEAYLGEDSHNKQIDDK